nr:unnamed protein product [Callosobruchus analis]
MDIFENEDGWIITKNQKGKVKLAACSEDESNIYEKTREWIEIAADNTKINTFRPKQGNSIATLFIRDLLNSERKDNYFEIKTANINILYRKVFICGTVVELNTRTDKHSIVVDDGTSCIKCIMPTVLNLIHSKLSTGNNMDDSCEGEGTQQSNGISSMIFSKVENLRKHTAEVKELKLGDIVTLVGSMSEYNGLRYVFINSIAKEPKGSVCYYDHMEYLLQLYSKLFDT